MDPEELARFWPVECEGEDAESEALHRLEQLRDRCACLSRDQEDLTAELTAFRIVYHGALGMLYVELERVRQRVGRLRTALDIAKQTPDLPAEELRGWVDTRTKETAAKLQALEDEVQQDAKLAEKAEYTRDVSADDKRLLRRLYRKLAIRFHPDLQMGPGAKRDCERMMVRIGDLYRVQDLEGIELIADEAGDVIEKVFLEPDEYRQWLTSHVERLQQRVAELERQIDQLWNSDLAVLMRRQRDAEQSGRDLFDEMATSAREEIKEQEAQLARLQDEVVSLPPAVRERIADWMDSESRVCGEGSGAGASLVGSALQSRCRE